MNAFDVAKNALGAIELLRSYHASSVAGHEETIKIANLVRAEAHKNPLDHGPFLLAFADALEKM